MRLKDKVAVITGAGTGLGRASALLFAKEGARVVVADIAPVTGQETAGLVKQAGGQAIFVHVDVSSGTDCKSMVKTAIDTYGRLDILFNNAGVSSGAGLLADRTEEQWNHILSINLTGVFLCTKYALPQMVKQGRGAVLNTASTAGQHAAPQTGPYGVSKAGVIHLTRLTAVEYAKNNIRCNCLLPYVMDTPFFNGAGRTEEQKVALFKRVIDSAPAGRLPRVEEVAQVALFLVSDEASYVSGQIVAADFASHC